MRFTLVAVLLAACAPVARTSGDRVDGAGGRVASDGGAGGSGSSGGAPAVGGTIDSRDADTSSKDARGDGGDQAPADARDAGASLADAETGDTGGSTVVPPTGPQTCGTHWSNPIATGAHDPSLVKEGDTYYVFATADGIDTTRRVPFQRSTDLVHWTNLGTVMQAIPAWGKSLGLSGTLEVWAPDVHLINGKYFAYYSISAWGDVTHSAIGLMTATALDPSSPRYGWIDLGLVVGSPEGGSGVDVIDPDLFIDDDGSWWLVYGSYRAGIRLVQLDPATGLWNRASPPAVLTTSLGEGSDIIKANGFYYLFVSRGTCCAALNSTYEIVYGRASKVGGPYLGKTGGAIDTSFVRLLPPGSDGNPGQGGQSFFKEHGQYYMVYHAYQPPAGDAVLNIRPIYFDNNDWVTLDPCLAKGYHP